MIVLDDAKSGDPLQRRHMGRVHELRSDLACRRALLRSPQPLRAHFSKLADEDRETGVGNGSTPR